MGPRDILQMNGNVPVSPPGLIPQTQPNHTWTTPFVSLSHQTIISLTPATSW